MISDAVSLAVFRASLRVCGETITYVRGETEITLTAIRGSTNWDANAVYPGNRIGNRSTDWIFAVADLVPDGEETPLVPERGDEIQTAAGTFRAMPFGPDSQLWKYHDRGRQVIRLYSKERT